MEATVIHSRTQRQNYNSEPDMEFRKADVNAWPEKVRKCLLVAGAAPLIAEEDQVGPAAHPKFREKIRNVKFHGSLGNVEAIGHFFVCKVFEQPIEHFLLASTQFGG
jgi:hypothetical protein